MKITFTGNFGDFNPGFPGEQPASVAQPLSIPRQYAIPAIADPAPPPAGLLACVACTCRSEATRVVPGMGPRTAQIFFLGQNPGEEEDASGLPFVGSSGDELNRWLAVLGLDRAKVFITNLVKCHSTNNRVPRTSEIQTCSNRWLPEELQGLPDVRLLVPLGKPAVVRVLGKSAPPMTPLMVHHYRIRILDRAVSVFPLPHPAFLLRAQHFGPLLRETLLPQIRETWQQEFPSVYRASQRT